MCYVVPPSESKMTMTSPAVPGDGLVCPEVAGETNRRMEPSPTRCTHVNCGGLLVDCSSGLAHLVFLFCGISSVIFGCMGSATNAFAPDWTVGRKVLLDLTVY